MTLWLVRAGKHGEREDFALDNNVVVIGWGELNRDLSSLKTRQELADLLQNTYPEQKPKTLSNWESQIWPFIREIKKGDLVALPLKHRAVIAIGEIEGEYRYKAENPLDARHTRPVKWKPELTRGQFAQDLLYSLGARRTVCRIQRNDAERRVKDILDGKTDRPILPPVGISTEQDTETTLDIEQYSQDQIASYINAKYKGHGLARLAAAILQAQGYQVRVSPEGPDGGVDITAGRGALGFEPPRLIVQVKSSDSPIDVAVVRELSGVMPRFGADQGLIVAWGGYKGNAEKEAALQYFKIRLWDASDVVRMLQEYYDRLPEDIQAEIPLKRVWILVEEEE